MSRTPAGSLETGVGTGGDPGGVLLDIQATGPANLRDVAKRLAVRPDGAEPLVQLLRRQRSRHNMTQIRHGTYIYILLHVHV